MKKLKLLFHWGELLGLALLLISFGWQCLEEHSSQLKNEVYMYELNEKLITLWEATYDEALHSERYNGNTMVTVNYDALDSSFKYWKEVQDEMTVIKLMLT